MTLTLRSAEILIGGVAKSGDLSVEAFNEKEEDVGMYELEDIDESIKKLIVEQLGPKAAFHMERKSFWEMDGDRRVVRTIDRNSGDYLMTAPIAGMVPGFLYWFYFYFEGEAYELKIRSYSNTEVVIEQGMPPDPVRGRFQDALREAFKVHSVFGHVFRKEHVLTPIFRSDVTAPKGNLD